MNHGPRAGRESEWTCCGSVRWSRCSCCSWHGCARATRCAGAERERRPRDRFRLRAVARRLSRRGALPPGEVLMDARAFTTPAVYLVVLLALAWPIGRWIADVLEGRPTWSVRIFGGLERWVLRLAGVRDDGEQTWR